MWVTQLLQMSLRVITAAIDPCHNGAKTFLKNKLILRLTQLLALIPRVITATIDTCHNVAKTRGNRDKG